MPGKSLPTNSWTYPITNKLPKQRCYCSQVL